MNAATVNNITFSHPGANGNGPLYEDFSLSFAAHQVTAVMGASGCGKSTLGKLLGGQLKVQHGEISWGATFEDKKNRFYMDQDPEKVFFPSQKVWRNVDYPMEMCGVPLAERKRRVDEILNEVRLDHRANEYPLRLSGGEQSRLALARVLSWEPRCVILDECMGALDLKTREIMINVLVNRAAVRDFTIIIISHSPNEVLKLADRCVVFGKRPVKVVADLTIDLPRPRQENTEAYQKLQGQLFSHLHNEL